MMDGAIRIRNVGKVFVRDERAVDVLQDVSLTIAAGTFVTLVGRSGCGKSTLLNMIAGLTDPTTGSIAFADENARRPRLDVGYMTQKDTLLPWRDVLANVALPLEVRGVARPQREARAHELIDLVGLAHAATRFPRELSGGMLRRASLARMLCAEPDILLLDEPFGALDAQLRAELQHELLTLWETTGKTVVFVTHDIDEALVLADRVIVLRAGGRIALDTQVTFARPRDARNVRTAPEFIAVHDALVEALGTGDAVPA